MDLLSLDPLPLDPCPLTDPTSKTDSGFQDSYGVGYGALRWIYFLDPPRGLSQEPNNSSTGWCGDAPAQSSTFLTCRRLSALSRHLFGSHKARCKAGFGLYKMSLGLVLGCSMDLVSRPTMGGHEAQHRGHMKDTQWTYQVNRASKCRAIVSPTSIYNSLSVFRVPPEKFPSASTCHTKPLQLDKCDKKGRTKGLRPQGGAKGTSYLLTVLPDQL